MTNFSPLNIENAQKSSIDNIYPSENFRARGTLNDMFKTPVRYERNISEHSLVVL